MSSDKKSQGRDIVSEVRKERRELEKTYRERALKMYPHICGRCAREFSGKRLRELTVHHKDHNHDNNPADGSNWELLCLYCHENEHARYKVADWVTGEPANEDLGPKLSGQPFAGLADLLKPKK
jgi:hypothetical protein